MEGQDRARDRDRGRKAFLSKENCTSPLYRNYMQKEKQGLLIG